MIPDRHPRDHLVLVPKRMATDADLAEIETVMKEPATLSDLVDPKNKLSSPLTDEELENQ
jgi:hypothetical protein